MDRLGPCPKTISLRAACGAIALLACQLATPASALIVPRPAAALVESCAPRPLPMGVVVNEGDIGGVPSRLEAMRAQQAGTLPLAESDMPGIIAVNPPMVPSGNAFAFSEGCTIAGLAPLIAIPRVSIPAVPEPVIADIPIEAAAIGMTAINLPATDALTAGTAGTAASLVEMPLATKGVISPALLSGESGGKAVLAPVDPDKPDVFGSVALAVSQTPLDSKWQRVAAGTLSPRGRLWRALIGDARKLDTEARIHLVNQWVNRRVRFADDSSRFAVGDRWASAAETLRAGVGDCEDYAIAKMKLLEAAGVKRGDMFLVIAKDLVRRADHALLVVRNGTRLVVLDNVTDRIVDAAAAQDYRPVMSYSAGKAWIHGYESEAAPSDRAPIDRAPVRVAMLGN